jgi:hypothetical protein
VSAEAPILIRSWKVGSHACTLTVPRPAACRALHAVFEWEPAVPERFSEAEWAQYRSGRDAALAEIAAELGITVAVLEL